MTDIFLIFSAYLVGAIPSAYLFGRCLKGIDLRQAGSGNIGAVNSFRQAGLLCGILTLGVDITKGYLAVWLAIRYGCLPLLPVLSAFMVVLGHNYNIFLGFKGGKGLASLLGAMLVLSPATILCVLPAMVILALFSRDTNTGAGLGILFLPFVLLVDRGQGGYFFVGMAISLLVVSRHLHDFRAYLQGRRKLI